MGLDTMTPIIPNEFYDGGNLPEVTIAPQNTNTAPYKHASEQSWWGWFLDMTEHNFNGGIDNIATASWAYNSIDNSKKRKFYYESTKKIKKITNGKVKIKPGKDIFQPMKKISAKASKLTSKLGPIGTTLSVINIVNEVKSDTWDAHTIVDATLLVGVGVAAVVGAPAVLIGIGIYGAADLFFDFGEKIDNTVGRNSEIWNDE